MFILILLLASTFIFSGCSEYPGLEGSPCSDRGLCSDGLTCSSEDICVQSEPEPEPDPDPSEEPEPEPQPEPDPDPDLEPTPNPFPGSTETGTDDFGAFAIIEIEGVDLTFRWIEPGTFSMGSPESEEGRFAEEGPVHQVTLTEGYWLAESEVTQALWEAVMGENLSEFDGSPERPVELVSWNDIQDFLAEVNTQYPGLALKLPTEAQWEYAARAGSVGARYGDLDEIAWYSENSAGTTHPVKQKIPNAWGLYDMLGNVWEWCHDFYSLYGSDSEVDPIGPSQGTYRVVRGGGWDLNAAGVRAAYRLDLDPSDQYSVIGFRLARGP